ncbi:MAG: SIMPL domain-containing protein, partial [Planctomycetota bacterium]|nr:SIMPL domain-containing protein [Planctomycetota bacterium]
MNSLLLKMILLLLLLGQAMVNELHAEEVQRKIKVAGTAVSKVVPDTIIWTLNVVSQDRELPRACGKNEEIVAGLIELQKNELGADAASEIQTGYLSIRKVFEKDGNGNDTEFKHFEVTRTVTLCQRSVKKFEQIYRALSQRPDIQATYRLESSDYAKIRWTTRLEAAKIAKTKAGEMTEVLDSKLGRVLEISE